MLILQVLVVVLFPRCPFVEFGDCLPVYDLGDPFVPIQFKSVKDAFKKAIEGICALVVVAGLGVALVVVQVLFLDDVGAHGLSAMSAQHEAFQRYFRVFLVDAVSLCIFLEESVYLQEYLFGDELLLVALHHLSLEHVVRHHAAVERIAEYLGHVLVAYLQPLFGEPCPYRLYGEVIEGFPVECLPDKPALGVDDYVALAVLPDHLKAHGRLCRPVPPQEHLPYPGHAFLSAQLVVEFAEEEEHLLLHLPGCVGGVDGLCDRDDLDAETAQLVGQPDGVVVAREAFEAVYQDVGYLAPVLLDEGDHGGKLLPFVRFGTFIGSAESGGNVVRHFFGVERTGLELRCEAEVVGLLLAAHARVDHAFLAALECLGFFGPLGKAVKK